MGRLWLQDRRRCVPWGTRVLKEDVIILGVDARRHVTHMEYHAHGVSWSNDEQWVEIC